MTKYYINENIEKYSIKMAKSGRRKRLHEFNHKKREYFKFLKNRTMEQSKVTIMELRKIIVAKILKTIGT